MTLILDEIARSRGRIVAQELSDVVAIELARTFDDAENVSEYRRLAREYSHQQLVDASVRSVEHTPHPTCLDLRRELHAELPAVSTRVREIIGCCVNRRDLTAMVLRGVQIIDCESRQLASSIDAARRSVCALVTRIAADYPSASLGIELDDRTETRRGQLRQDAIAAAQAAGLPVWQFTFGDLAAGVSMPAAPIKTYTRQIMQGIWPELEVRRIAAASYDAALVAAVLYGRVLFNAIRERRGR